MNVRWNSCGPVAIAVLLCLVTLVTITNAGVPMSRYEAFMKQQSQELGLYNASDKVVVLTNVNFNETVLSQNRSSLVEFYNSYCGHCKRFAPHYKTLAEKLYSWRDVLPICALDCAAEENNDICREYEIMAYPTMRYYGPDYAISKDNLGRSIETQDLSEIRSSLAQFVLAENKTGKMTNWPNLRNLTESESNKLFEGLDSQRHYVVLVYEPENSTIGVETILHFIRWPSIQVRRVTDSSVAAKFHIDGVRYKVATVSRNGNIVPYSLSNDTTEGYVATIESFLRSQTFTERPDLQRVLLANSTPGIAHDEEHRMEEAERAVILKEVHRNKHLVYQADLELAIRGIIFNEIPKTGDISGERLLALQRLLSVLKRYNPMGIAGRTLISKLYDYVVQFNQKITGQEFEEELLRLEKQLSPIFSAKHYIGCSPSRPGYRGFTCGLWQLFHFMTVQAARSEESQDPLEVLQALHGYARNFFGCTDCSEHFQAMASRRKIWSVPNKEEAILWLWAAHNAVNLRLAGDSTEDPEFPKIQFPTPSSCPQCYKHPVTSPANLDVDWDKDAVLSFMKNIHNPEYVSRFGLERDDVLPPSLDKIRQKRMISNVFSDMDMRMGILLYGFCIVMLVAAFKLFAFKGYRKKPYGHDMLGKA